MGHVLAVVLVLVIGSTPTTVVALRSEPSASHAVPSVAEAAAEAPSSDALPVSGGDACGVLTDEEILRASGGSAILARNPGPQSFLSAGCEWEIEIPDGFPATLTVGAAATGGRAHYDMMVPVSDIGDPVPGVGDDAVDLGFGSVLAVQGDSVVDVGYGGFGSAGRPSALVTRALAWAALTRLAAAPVLLSEPALAGPGVLPTDQGSLNAVAALRTPEFTDASLAAGHALLARGGIEVVDPATGATLNGVDEPTGLRYMDLQAHSMSLEAWAGNGHQGAALDDVVPMPEDLPPTSWVLAGWVAAVDSPNARLARALMQGQDVTDPTAMVFPTLVLALFSADLMREATAESDPGDDPTARRSFVSGALTAALPEIRTAQAGICTNAQRFVDDAIHTVFSYLKVSPPDQGPVRIIASVWNWIVDRGEALAREVAGALTAPAIAAIRSVAGVVATIAHVVAAIVPYSLIVYAPPTGNIILPIDPEPARADDFRVLVTQGTLPDWPAVIVDCAQVAQVSLPTFRPAGDAVTWEMVAADGLLIPGTPELVLNEQGSAVYPFTTIVQPKEVAGGPQALQVVTVHVTIARREGTEQRSKLKAALFAQVPDIVRPFAERALQPIVDGLLERVERLLDVKGNASVDVVYHERPPATPPPADPDPGIDVGAGNQAVWVYKDRPYSDEVVEPLRIIELYSCSGPYGPWSGVLRTGAINALGAPTGPVVQIHEFPVEITFEGRSGTQTATIADTVQVEIQYGPGFSDTVDFDYEVLVSVDGTTMSYDGLGGSWELPIEPAPAGSCPRPAG